MRKFLLAVCALLFITAGVAMGQQAVCPKDVPTVKTGGKVNGATLGSGSATASSVMTRSVTPTAYSKIDTVSNTAVDTFKQTVGSEVNSLYTWAYVDGISGTNTSCVLKLWGVGDPDNINSATGIQTYTVTAGTKVYPGLINSGIGMPYRGFWWTWTGSGTHSTAWHLGMVIR